MTKRQWLWIPIAALLFGAPLSSEAEELNEDQVSALVPQYYDTTGEWAGTFTIQSINRWQEVDLTADHLLLYVDYHYNPVPGNSQGRTDSGDDQRVFDLKKVNGHWIIGSMGGYHSAKF